MSSDIRPHRNRGDIVISDRYLPSSFVLQRIDGLAWETIAALNEGADVPDVAVILAADEAVITTRLAQRGRHSRFEAMPDAARTETSLYDNTARRLSTAGWPIWQLNTTPSTPADLAKALANRILATTARRQPERA